ncbi:unnamed protein product, partial [Iphiclides podalirius]
MRYIGEFWPSFVLLNPTPPSDDSILDFKWQAVNNTEHMNYLDINGNFTMLTDPEAKRVQFWDWLYDNYAKEEQ